MHQRLSLTSGGSCHERWRMWRRSCQVQCVWESGTRGTTLQTAHGTAFGWFRPHGRGVSARASDSSFRMATWGALDGMIWGPSYSEAPKTKRRASLTGSTLGLRICGGKVDWKANSRWLLTASTEDTLLLRELSKLRIETPEHSDWCLGRLWQLEFALALFQVALCVFVVVVVNYMYPTQRGSVKRRSM